MPIRVALAQAATRPEPTTDALVVLGVVVLALALFVTERLPIDVTAISLIVILVVLEPWTGIDPATGISGFANEATITVLAMLILSGGISRTGLVQALGRRMAAFAGGDVRKQVFATVLATGPVSGFLNNTPVVALLVPVVTDVANRGTPRPRSCSFRSRTPPSSAVCSRSSAPPRTSSRATSAPASGRSTPNSTGSRCSSSRGWAPSSSSSAGST